MLAWGGVSMNPDNDRYSQMAEMQQIADSEPYPISQTMLNKVLPGFAILAGIFIVALIAWRSI